MKDKIKQIKYSRLKSEEKWFIDLITDLEEVKHNERKNITHWKKEGKILFEQNIEDGILHVSHSRIWSVLKSIYGYDNIGVSIFINDIVERQLNWSGLKPLPKDIIGKQLT